MIEAVKKWLGVGGDARSTLWPATRKAHLAKEPCCRACGSKERLNVHHVEPFHVRKDLELDDRNLVTLCEAPGHNCHLVFGHLLDWKSWNTAVLADADAYRDKVRRRPYAAV